MFVYKYDEKGIFVGLEETELDPLESEVQGKEVYLLPPKATFTKPKTSNGYAPVWNGEKWTQVEDHRGAKYWLPGDKYGSPAREMVELGPLPVGASLTEPEMSQEEKNIQIQDHFSQAIQTILDKEAQKFNYDNCLSVCSYVDTGVQKFDDEGKAFRAWRSAVWAKSYEILNAILAGKRTIPSEEDLLAEIPALKIVYQHNSNVG